MVAISQEDPSLDKAPGILTGLDPVPTFPIAVDLDQKATRPYERTTAYLIDAKGVVRQVFPMMTHMRASAATLLSDADALLKPDAR